jgi:ABC-type thiamin/hydroxymethylpyrimidine transport system permease subunit
MAALVSIVANVNYNIERLVSKLVDGLGQTLVLNLNLCQNI